MSIGLGDHREKEVLPPLLLIPLRERDRMRQCDSNLVENVKKPVLENRSYVVVRCRGKTKQEALVLPSNNR
jgi:hypothetical protein